jgi:hypothetical protein
VDPDLAETDQPYAYAGDDPVNAGDPSGMFTAPNPDDVLTSYMALNPNGHGQYDAYLTYTQWGHMQPHVHQFESVVAKFIGYPPSWDEVTYQFTEAIDMTLRSPQQLPIWQPKYDTYLYEAPYDIVSTPDYNVKVLQFYVGVGRVSHIITTAYFTTAPSNITQGIFLGTSTLSYLVGTPCYVETTL